MSRCSCKAAVLYDKAKHMYVLNYDLKTLDQNYEDEGDKKLAHASEELYITKEKDEDDEHYKIINCLDAILQRIKDHGKVKKGDEPIYTLVLRDDNSNCSLFSLEDAGYAFGITHTLHNNKYQTET